MKYINIYPIHLEWDWRNSEIPILQLEVDSQIDRKLHFKLN
jgi:hypothetical protein